MPETATNVFKQINTAKTDYDSLSSWGQFELNKVTDNPEALFQRIDTSKKMDEIHEYLNQKYGETKKTEEIKHKPQIEYYNLDVIISIGYRVKSKQGTQFRQWANKVLKDHLLKGYSFNQRIERLEQRVSATENKIDFFVKTALPPVEGIFYDGNMLEPFSFVNNLIRSAQKRIILIDNYIDETVLLRLAERKKGIKTTIYTKQLSPSFKLALQQHNHHYEKIEVKQFDKSHDRFLIIDDMVYHIGASIKDLGKKWFAFCKMAINAEEIINRI